MEIEIFIEFPVRSWISKVNGFRRFHRNKNLDQRKYPGENPFMRIFFYLVICLAYGNAAAFQLNMDNRHPVD